MERLGLCLVFFLWCFFLPWDFFIFFGLGDMDPARTADALAIVLIPPWHTVHVPVNTRTLGWFGMRPFFSTRMVVDRLQELQCAFTMVTIVFVPIIHRGTNTTFFRLPRETSDVPDLQSRVPDDFGCHF